MELIIKPTGRCNFNCKFCSANGLDIQHPKDEKVPDGIKKLIKDLNVKNIIITGGEPLMMKPEYYYELYDLIGNKGNMSITTNLKDFYLNPEKWAPIFNESWFHVATSFNYGDTRMWDKNTVYDDVMFTKVIAKYHEYVNDNIPIFLAVIDENNEDKVLDHIYLAKKLGTKVKLNCAIGVGLQGKTYQRYKMFKNYIKIIDMGLENYECYCSNRDKDECPRNTSLLCENSIRCCYIDSKDILHVSTCDEQISMGNDLSPNKIVPNEPNTPLLVDINEFITPECAYCELCNLCNGCKTNRDEAKKDPNYCTEMKKLEPDIIRLGWRL